MSMYLDVPCPLPPVQRINTRLLQCSVHNQTLNYITYPARQPAYSSASKKSFLCTKSILKKYAHTHGGTL